MLFNEVLFHRKRSPFPKRGRLSLCSSERVARSAERGPLSLLGRVARSAERGPLCSSGKVAAQANGRGPLSTSGKVAAQPTEEIKTLIIYLCNIRIAFGDVLFRRASLRLNRCKGYRIYREYSQFLFVFQA